MYKDISIKDIRPAAENYRRTFDEDTLAELITSVRSKGILQPILVRPLKKPRGKFEIVAGHRRHTAALAAGLAQMPCMVRELSDEEALEVQVIENSQREDPNPMDEAHGFKRLIEMGKHTTETLAEKIGHSTKYVLSRMRLLNLSEEAQEAVATGEVSLGHAVLMTRLKNPVDQKRLLEMVLMSTGLTVKEAAGRLCQFSRDLSEAEFDTGACKECPGRARNQTDLFPELKGGKDECMDAECFYDKRLAHWGGWLDEKRKEGFRIITDGKAVPIGRSDGAVKIGTEKTNWQITVPPRYDEDCAECRERHAFYLHEKSYGGGYREIEHGELCLNPECLDRMRRAEAGDGETGAGNPVGERDEGLGDWQKERLARALIARSLRDRLDDRLGNPRLNILQRVALFAMFLALDDYGLDNEAEKAFFEEFLPEFEETEDVDMYDRETVFRVLGEIPAERLDDAIRSLAMAYVHGDLPLTAMVIGKEAADLGASVAVDEEYLKEFEGRDLRGLVAELWPEEDARPMVLRELDGMEDEAIRDMILAQGDALTGRLPAAARGLLTPEEVETPFDECEGCGEEKEDCACEGGGEA